MRSDNNSAGGGDAVRSPRFVHWVAFLVFALITMGSAIQAVSSCDEGGIQDRRRIALLSLLGALTPAISNTEELGMRALTASLLVLADIFVSHTFLIA